MADSRRPARKRKDDTSVEEPRNGVSSHGNTDGAALATASTGGQQGRRKRLKRTSSRSQVQTSSNPPASSPLPPRGPLIMSVPKIWPDYLNHLDKTHRALNLVYTFCCARRHLITSFEMIKSAVEQHTRQELTISDILGIKALMPRTIRFEYVSAATLEVTVYDSSNPKEPASVAGAYGFLQNELRPVPSEDGNVVLLFELIDGELGRRIENPYSFWPIDSRRRPPSYTDDEVMDLVERRNHSFDSAVKHFLHQCQNQGVDATDRLKSLAISYTPLPPFPLQQMLDASAQTLAMAPPSSIPKDRKSISSILQEIQSMDMYVGQIVPDGHRVFTHQLPIYGELNFQLSQDVVNALYNARGITQLYSHQAEAINYLHDGFNVIVSTSTSSGKSLIYQIPMLNELESDPTSRGIYIFPTKALAQDQRRSMKELLDYMPGLAGTVVNTFDGDTPMQDRESIREEARIIFTNPDMLHITILPQEGKWRTFLQNLKYVVVDELHVYNGLFGAHVALIMRRLRRVCAAVGNHSVKFISCSATIANPEEHMKKIFGIQDVRLIDYDGSPSGQKEFVCWNTPFKDPKDPSSGRGDAYAEAAKLFCQLILRGIRIITFCRVRKQCEVLLRTVKEELNRLDRPEVVPLVMGYRGGYSTQDRRNIESQMFEGKLIGIIATSALELGVDIGTLDAVMTVGFPYSISNLRQQSGRAGRRNKDSLSILLGDSFPTDQYYMNNPDEIFTKPNCALQVDIENIIVLEGHVQCAAFEMPIQVTQDVAYFGPQLPEIAKEKLVEDSLGFYHCQARYRPYPSKLVSIRNVEEEQFAVVDITHGRNVILEQVEMSRTYFTIYEGGIFLHQGCAYLVKEFNTDTKVASVERTRVSWTTRQRDYTDVDPIETEIIGNIPNTSSKAYCGPIRIRSVVFGFFKVDKRGRILDAVAVDNPPVEYFSKGMWLDVPKSALDILKARNLHVGAAIHAAEHAILSLVPSFVISMPEDVRTECKNAHKEFAKKESSRKRPARLTFYDAKGGKCGSGIAQKVFEYIDLLLNQACERVSTCECMAGCLECICSERCKEANAVMSKAGAEVILKSLLNLDIDIEALPMGPENQVPINSETIVPATEISCANGKSVPIVNLEKSSPMDDC